jgi:hypothetical protein
MDDDGGQFDPSQVPAIEDLEQARYWIRVMHRRTVRDASDINDLSERVRQLERPSFSWSVLCICLTAVLLGLVVATS